MFAFVIEQIGHAHLHDLERLYLSGVLDVGTSAQIDQGTAAVDSTALSSHELVDVVKLVLAVGEHLLEVLLGNLQSVEALLLLEDA